MDAINKVSVRTLVESVMIGGDIVAGGSYARMLEGARGHRRLQSCAEEGALSEVSVQTDVQEYGLSLCVQGRVDLLWMDGEVPVCVEEIKTTRRDPTSIGEGDYPLHWAQAECYAHMLCEKYSLSGIQVRLTYAVADGEAISRMTREYKAETLAERFDRLVREYLRMALERAAWISMRDESIRAVGFPFATYRAGQREMAARAYITIRDGGALLAEAPTGIGKSAAMLFAALKAMGEGHTGRIFYLTARGTTQQAARDALKLLNVNGLRARSITLAPKERMCAQPGAACVPEECPRAKGHYDRLREALMEALTYDAHSPGDVLELCEKHSICPFEFELDLSLECDVIIGDYNYAFDPRAKLRRYFMDKSDYTLLIDEAHNLPDRAREMYSASLSRKDFALLRREIGRISRKSALYKSTAALARELKVLEQPGERRIEMPDELIDCVKVFLSEAEGILGEVRLYSARLLDCFFSALSFTHAWDMMRDYPADFTTLAQPPEVKIYCTHPSGPLGECYSLCRAVVLFSATLKPMRYFSDVCGCEKAGIISLPSPFPRENLRVIINPVSTKYRDRDASATSVAGAIAAMASSRGNGNFLAFFPSYAYMNMIHPLLSEMLPGIRIEKQAGGMDADQRAAYLDMFEENPKETMLALAVMGGLFGEGIDLPGERLSGAAIVGVGLPQVCLERETLRERYGTEPDGFAYAYVYPGAARVAQAAGRVIRAQEDKGAILLIDGRFTQPPYRSLLPTHWSPLRLNNTGEITDVLREFWRMVR